MRFVPEVICVLVELALSAEDVGFGTQGLYGGLARGGAASRSGLFLSRVARPVDNVIADEWYEGVGVGAAFGGDREELRPGLDGFQGLSISRPGQEPAKEFRWVLQSANWGVDFFSRILLWLTSSMPFAIDAQMGFVPGCTVLGMTMALTQRRCNIGTHCLEDTTAKVPEWPSRRALTYSPGASIGEQSGRSPLSAYFPQIWDRVVGYFRYGDKCGKPLMEDASFDAGSSGHAVYGNQFGLALGRSRASRSCPPPPQHCRRWRVPLRATGHRLHVR